MGRRPRFDAPDAPVDGDYAFDKLKNIPDDDEHYYFLPSERDLPRYQHFGAELMRHTPGGVGFAFDSANRTEGDVLKARGHYLVRMTAEQKKAYDAKRDTEADRMEAGIRATAAKFKGQTTQSTFTGT